MLADEWNAWVERHMTTFGLTNDADVAMINAWQAAFLVHSYTADELRDATVYMAATKPPRWRADHLPAIHARIQDQRKQQRRHNEESAHRDGVAPHDVCNGKGWVTVPHLRHVIDGSWVHPWYTAAVVCFCDRGLRMLESMARRERKPMTLGGYESLNPGWQEQVRIRTLGREADNQASRASDWADKTAFGASVGEVLRRAKD